MRRRFLFPAAALIVLLGTLFYFERGGHTPDGQPALRSLTVSNLAELPAAFNAASGRTRVLVLLSPT